MINRVPLSTAQMVALSLPTFAFAGYDLARRNFLAIYLSGDLGLSIGTVGWLIALANFAAIPAEVFAGALGDIGSSRLGRRGPWMILGTVLIVLGSGALLLANRSSPIFAPTFIPTFTLALALTGLVMGWALCNVTHGAWALEITADSEARARIFGWRSLFGIGGAIGFSWLAASFGHRVASPFLTIMLPLLIGAVLAHALLIARVPEVPTTASPWNCGMLVTPLRLLVANRPNRQLAALFALNGAHTAITSTGYLYVANFGLALPSWGAAGILVQTICAAIGAFLAIRLGSRMSAAGLLRSALWANLLLAVALIAVPPHRPDVLMLWSALFGLFSVVDFMALRMMLGDRLDSHVGAGRDDAQAAAHYAGFHLPFNLCAALAGGLLFLGYRALGFDPGAAQSAAQVFAPVILMPAIAAITLMATSLWILAVFHRNRPGEAEEEQENYADDPKPQI